MENLYIPEKLKVGFQKRSDTYTGKLAFITYIDTKGVLRQEKSWNGWRDQKITALELDNQPRSGYVLNKGVERYGHWNSGRSMVRVYDPRGFEFEITLDNLIGVLMHSDVSKRDIMEECVLAWSGKNVILLPANSDEYKQSVEFTGKQSQKVSARSLVAGHLYSQKKEKENLMYIGYYEWFEWEGYSDITQRSFGKKHVFHNGNRFVIPNVASLAANVSIDVDVNYPLLAEEFINSQHARLFTSVEINENEYTGNYLYKIDDKNKLTEINIKNDDDSDEEDSEEEDNYYYYYNSLEYIDLNKYKVENKNKLILKETNSNSYYYHNSPRKDKEYLEIKKYFEEKKYNMKKVNSNDLKEAAIALGYRDLNLIDSSGKISKYIKYN